MKYLLRSYYCFAESVLLRRERAGKIPMLFTAGVSQERVTRGFSAPLFTLGR